jgi:hypothetical protein
VLDVIRDYAARYPRIVGWRVLYAYALWRAGHSAAFSAEYASLKSSCFDLPDDLNWMVSMAWLSEMSHARSDVEGCALLYERLLPYASRLVMVGYAGIACVGSVQRYLALLAATLQRTEDTKRHFERAIAANRQAAATVPLLYSLCDFAGWLRSVGSAADGAAYAAEALPLIKERGLVALLRRAELAL